MLCNSGLGKQDLDDDGKFCAAAVADIGVTHSSYSRAAAPHTCLPRELPLARGTVSHFPIVSKLANCRPKSLPISTRGLFGR